MLGRGLFFLFGAIRDNTRRLRLMLPIETERLILRHLQARDLEEYLGYRNDPEVARYQGWEHITREQAETTVNDQAALAPGTPGKTFLFAVELKSEGRLIGDLGLMIREHDPHQGMTGYTFSRAYQGKGYATEAFIGMLDLMFDPDGPNMHRIFALVEPENTPSVKLLERAGFRREGHFIRARWFKGRWVDDYQYAMLQSEWHEKRPAK